MAITNYLLATLLMVGCGDENADIFAGLEQKRELRVITRNSPTTYFFDGDQPSGFEYDLLMAFADAQGYRLTIEVAFTLDELLEQLAAGEAHIAAAGLTLTPERQARFTASDSYLQHSPLVVYKSGKRRPRKLADLAGRDLVVLAGSSHAELLERLVPDYPNLQWREIQAADTLELMQLVTSERAELAILDSTEFKIQQQLFPRLVAAIDLGEDESIAWYLPKTPGALDLKSEIDDFFVSAEQEGLLSAIKDRHFGTANLTSRISAFTFNSRVESTLPQWEPLLKSIAGEYRMDWRLLAAISYQESHWNPEARSRTGVEGLMMLTRITANELGITDRRDPEQSLRGGARFLRNLLRRLPADIEDPHRLWMALAAYNIGMGHLEDARILAEREGLDPHLWDDVRSQLPKLQNPDVYPRTRFGFARGVEAQTYVDNIRQYYSALQLKTAADYRIAPPVDVSVLLTAELETGLPHAL